MSVKKYTSDLYQVGGSLSSDNLTYVVRSADRQLYEALLRGEFCYVFSSYQMGKSSLKVRLKKRLRKLGMDCIFLDMSYIGSQNLNSEIWYKTIAFELWRRFKLTKKVNFKAWWQKQQGLSARQKLQDWLKDVILLYVKAAKIFILIDEIDSVLNLNFPTNDFFALIRYFYEARVNDGNFNRLNFALFGSTTPSELIDDSSKSPFALGTAIALSEFTAPEASPLLYGLSNYFQEPETVLKAILHWTGGQPFLTQKLCKLAITHVLPNQYHLAPQEINSWIEQLVRQCIVQHWEIQDEPQHLRTIRDRSLFTVPNSPRLCKDYIVPSSQQYSLLKNDLTPTNLSVYREVLHNGFVMVDKSFEQQQCLLTGLVTVRENKLVVSNPIYREIFNLTWVNNN